MPIHRYQCAADNASIRLQNQATVSTIYLYVETRNSSCRFGDLNTFFTAHVGSIICVYHIQEIEEFFVHYQLVCWMFAETMTPFDTV